MPDSNKLMLIIGIDKYSSNALEPLPPCRKDAEDISALFTELGYTNYGDSPIIGSEIIEDKFSWATLRETIINFFNQAKPSQTLLFYFSGHGIISKGDVFLASPQVDAQDPSARGFPFSDLEKYMGQSKSRRIVGIIDSCHSGGLGLPGSKLKKKNAENAAKQALATFDKSWKDTPKTENRALLLSSQSYEQSNAIEGQNSLYTKYLIKGLRGVKDHKGKDGTLIPGSIDQYGNVTPQTLHSYLYWAIGELPHGQTPRRKIDATSEIVLAHYEHLLKPAVESVSELSRRELGTSPADEIGQKAEKIKQACERLFKSRKALMEAGKGRNAKLLEDIEKTSKDLKDLYSKSETIKVASSFATQQWKQGRIELKSYENKISKLTGDMADIEFEFNRCARIELEKFEQQLGTSFREQGFPSTLPAVGQESKLDITEEKKEKVEALAESFDETRKKLDEVGVEKSSGDAEGLSQFGRLQTSHKAPPKSPRNRPRKCDCMEHSRRGLSQFGQLHTSHKTLQKSPKNRPRTCEGMEQPRRGL